MTTEKNGNGGPLSRVIMGSIVTLALAGFSGAFWLGTLSSRMSTAELAQAHLTASVDVLNATAQQTATGVAEIKKDIEYIRQAIENKTP